MGRNQKQSFDFFRFDTDFFSNKKIKALRRAHGGIGILTYLYILSYAYGHDGYFIPIPDIKAFCYDVAESIENNNISHVVTRVSECLNYLADTGMVDPIRLAGGIITGVNLQRQYMEMCHVAKRRCEIKKEYSLVGTPCDSTVKNGIYSEKTSINSEEMRIYSEEMQQKESKVKILSKSACAGAHAREEEALRERIAESEFLKQMPASFIEENKEKVLSGKYRSYRRPSVKTSSAGFENQRTYTKEELDSLVTDVDDINI